MRVLATCSAFLWAGAAPPTGHHLSPQESVRYRSLPGPPSLSRRCLQLQSFMLDDKEIGRYVDQRREQIDSFIADHFSCRGTLRVFWRTLTTDVVRHPINVVLAIPFLFVGKAASWLEKLGWYSAAKVLNRVPLRLRTAFENTREQQIVGGLLGLSDEMPELRQALETQINAFMATRAAILDFASGGLTIAVAYSLFGRASLSPYDMAQHLAGSRASGLHPTLCWAGGSVSRSISCFRPNRRHFRF